MRSKKSQSLGGRCHILGHSNVRIPSLKAFKDLLFTAMFFPEKCPYPASAQSIVASA